jgi:ribosome-associated translation inhibitor RaiA
MTLRISGKNMDVGDALRGKAEDHFDAVVGKYFDGGYDGHLTLTPAISAYEGMALNIEKRLRRYNRKLKQHRQGNGAGDAALTAQYTVFGSADDIEEMEEDYAPPVIAEATKNLREMSVEEAVMELDLTGGQVVMFRRAGHGGLNVVYRRTDGNIGWIDPALGAN